MTNEIKHYGTPRHSGRYEWGSGENPEQRDPSFIGRINALKKQGMSDVDIAKGEGMNTTQLRIRRSLIKAEQRKIDTIHANRLKEKGYSNVEIGKKMGGRNESSVRSLLDSAIQTRSEEADSTAKMLKSSVDKKGFIDVGLGVERHIGISRTKLKNSLAMLEEEGYAVHNVLVDQLGTSKKTRIMVLAKPGTSYIDVVQNKDQIKMITDHTIDNGKTFLGLEPIQSVDSSRIKIRYGTEGGADKDGVIELRRGVSDLSLGNAKYMQVRVGVDDTHYLKGMAMYTDDLPKGVDIIYNTNKAVGTPKEKVFKEMKRDKDGVIDPDNPFGANVRQQHYITDAGLKIKDSAKMFDLKTKGDMSYSEISKNMNVSEDIVRKAVTVKALNVVNEEGEWRDKWSKSLSSQMLSKQAPALAEKQLKLAFEQKKQAFDEIVSLTNPLVKKRLMDSFADDCDSSAVHLKSAALPRTSWHVLLPFTSIKENEVYAPNYNDGEKVVLIRYPHGGIFEIPELTVNNRNRDAKQILSDKKGTAKDAIGIHPKVAEKLSGADFDGDAVLVIPNNNGGIKTAASLKGLLHFDPKVQYKGYDGMPTIDGGIFNAKTGKAEFAEGQKPKNQTMQMKMGDISNLITDMTIKGAVPTGEEIARAVRHSMVVIDSQKHSLDYKTSYAENQIGALKKKYQGSSRSGAATLISRASSEIRPNIRKRLKDDPNTGAIVYEDIQGTYLNKKGNLVNLATYTDKKGKLVQRTTSSKKMAEVKDAFDLSSGTPMETVYATHANKLKALANQSRKVSLNIKPPLMSSSAKKVYKPEVDSLLAQLNTALKNKPLERQAHLLGNSVLAAKKEANPFMDNAEIKKIKGQALAAARVRVGAKKEPITISDREWAAIQAGALSANIVSQILSNTNIDKVKELATPRSAKVLTASKIASIKRKIAAGYTQAEVAESVGISTSTIAKVMQ